jgi:DNA-binding NarL/FixJ family response regulator
LIKPLRILIARDCEIFRNGLRQLLEEQEGWQVLAELANGREAVESTGNLNPEIVVLNASMPGLGGPEAAGRILESHPHPSYSFSACISLVNIHDVLNLGARGYLLKGGERRDLVPAVDMLSRRQPFCTWKILETLIADFPLQDRQTSDSGPSPVCLTLGEGLSVNWWQEQLALRLGISIKTAIRHKTKMMRKLGLESISELMRYAIRMGVKGESTFKTQ